MKRNDYSNYSRGQEISGVTFQQHQNQVIESLNTVMLSLGLDPDDKTVLWGLVNDGSETTYNISEGAIFTQGEIFLVDAFSGADSSNVPVLNPVDIEVGEPVRFADGSINAVHIDHKYQIALAAVDSGEVNFSDLKQLKDVLALMLDVDAKLDTFKADLIGGASEGFDTLADLEAALGGDINFGTNLLQQLATKASQVNHDTLDTRVKANEVVVGGIESYRSKGGSNIAEGATVNHLTASLERVYSGTNKVLTFSSASIAAADLVVADDNPRRILTFFSMFLDKEGTGADSLNIYIKYRVNGSGWTNLRIYNFIVSQLVHVELKASVEFVSTPVGDVEFALEFERVIADSTYVSYDSSITFDYWIN